LLKTKYLVVLLVILLLLLLGLGYLYLTITRPPGREVVRSTGLSPVQAIYGFGKGPDELLERPHGVAVDDRGNIYTTDSGHGRVVVFDRNGQFLFKFGTKVTIPNKAKPGNFTAPLGIAVDSKNNRIYVADRMRHQVLIFDMRGKFIKEFGLMMPINPVVYGDRLYITTYGPIYVYDLKGNQLERWGKRGRLKGEFDFPQGIAVGRDGVIYVADSNNARVLALSSKGEVVWTVGRPPISLLDPTREIGYPAGLAIGDDQNLYVIDSFHFSIKIFDRKGKMLAEVGAGHSGDREGEFYYPVGMAYMGGNTFVIADKYNNRLQIMRVSLAEAEASAGKKGFTGLVWEALKPWCPWIVIFLLILILIIVGVYEARRRGGSEEDA
jgi:DNA-binding beta-propeller fold protein YncE